MADPDPDGLVNSAGLALVKKAFFENKNSARRR